MSKWSCRRLTINIMSDPLETLWNCFFHATASNICSFYSNLKRQEKTGPVWMQRKQTGGMKEQEEEADKIRAVASVGKLKNFINCVCFREGGCSGCRWSAQSQWEGRRGATDHSPHTKHPGSCGGEQQKGEKREEEARQGLPAAPLLEEMWSFTALWNACLPQLAALLRAETVRLTEKSFCNKTVVKLLNAPFTTTDKKNLRTRTALAV